MSFISKLKLQFGIIPDTQHVEETRAATQKEWEEYNTFAKSKELKHFEELSQFVNSEEFEQRKKAIMAQKFSETEEYQKLQRYKELKKAPHIKTYYKVKNSQNLQDYLNTEKSKELAEYKELDEYINSSEFQNAKQLPKKEFKESDAAEKEKRYNALSKSPAIKKYFKFKQSEKFKTYQEVSNSEEIKEFEELEKFINSDEFKKVKEYMELSPKKKFEQSEEYQKLQEYLELKKSDKIIWYYSLEGTHKFDEIKHWNLTFEDTFEKNKLDTAKWITKYFYGEAILKDTYTLQSDKHFVTDGTNIELEEGKLNIITRKEEAEGKAWHPKFGFHPKKFEYTSGLINNGPTFRQQYGKFEAKVKLTPGIGHAFWLVGEKALPQINVFKFNKNKIRQGIYEGEKLSKKEIQKNESSLPGKKYSDDYHIFTLEWTPAGITWKINGLEAKKITSPVPDAPLYMVLSSGIYNGKVNDEMLPATMEVDWVRCYEENPEYKTTKDNQEDNAQ